MTRARNIAGFSTITTTPSPIHVGPIGVLTATRINGEFGVVDVQARTIEAVSIAATNFQVSGITTGLNVSGIITAQNGINFNGTSTGLNVSGVATFANNVNIGGVLTYEDVTRVDSVGVVTARGLSIFGNTTGLNATGVSTFTGDVSIADKIIHTGDTNTAIRFPGADTFTVETAGSERVRVDSTYQLQVFDDTDVRVFVANTTAASSQDATLFFGPANSVTGATITCTSEEDFSSSANRTARLTFSTRKDGTLAERLSIKSDGKIGIGDDAPDALLSIKGDSNEDSNPSIRLKDGTDTREAWISNNAGDLLLANGGNDNAYHSRIRLMDAKIINFDVEGIPGALNIDSTGALGLGINSPKNNSGNYRQLQIGFGAHFYGRTDDTPMYLVSNGYRDGSDWKYTGNTTASQIALGTNIQFFNAPSGTADNAITFTERLRITSDGDLSLRSTTQNANLGLKANSTAINLNLGSTAGASPRMYFFGTGNGQSTAGDIFMGTGTGGILHFRSAELIKFEVNSDSTTAEALRITSGGTVGINITSPDSNSMLDVMSDKTGTTVNSNRVAIFRTNGGGRDAHITLSNSSNTPVHIGTLSSALYFTTNDEERLRITSGGHVSVVSNSFAVGNPDNNVGMHTKVKGPGFLGPGSNVTLSMGTAYAGGRIIVHAYKTSDATKQTTYYADFQARGTGNGFRANERTVVQGSGVNYSVGDATKGFKITNNESFTITYAMMIEIVGNIPF